MAEKNETKEIVVEDEGVVTVDISDNPDLANVEGVEGEEGAAVEGKPEPKAEPKKVPRAKLNEQKSTALDPSVEARLAEANQRVADETKKREAAEATAAAERNRAETAQRLANQRGQEAEAALEHAQQVQAQHYDSAIDSANKEVEAYQNQLQAAFEAGEFAKAAQLQTKLSKATSTLDRLESEKTKLEAQPTAKPYEGRVEVTPAYQNVVEQYLAGFSVRDQAWLRAHPECMPNKVRTQDGREYYLGGNEQANAKMMEGHRDAIAKNFQPGSDDYYRIVEEHTGHRQPVSAAAHLTPAGEGEEEGEGGVQVREHTRQVPQAKPKPRIVPAAPVSRDAPGANGQKAQRTVTLSKEQQDAAKMSFPQDPPNVAFGKYARNLLELEAEGKMGRLSH